MWNQRSLLPLLLITLIASEGMITDAMAGGTDVTDSGAEAVARGGAFVAKADSPAAVNYNPAGFAKLRGHHVTISSNIVFNSYDFTAQPGQLPYGQDAAGQTPTLSNQASLFAAPLHLMVTSDFGVFDRMTFAAGFYGAPGIGEKRYSDTSDSAAGLQRYDLAALETSLLYPTLGLAYRVFDWLDVGATFQIAMITMKTSSYTISGAGCADLGDPACDVRADIDASDLFSPTGSFGVLARPFSHSEFGLMLRLPSSTKATGKASVNLGTNVERVANAVVTPLIDNPNPNVSITGDFPLMLRWGGRYIFYRDTEESGDIELNLGYEAWSSASKRTVQLDANSFGEPIPPTIVDWKMKDTFSFRLGGSYRFALAPEFDLVARAGIFGETETTDVSDTTLNVYGPKRIGLTAGMGVRWDRFQLDVAYGHTFLPTREVSNSSIRALSFDSTGETGPVVGNGRYTGSLDTFSLQLTVSFGRGAEPTLRFARQPSLGERFYAGRRPAIDRRLATTQSVDHRPKEEPQQASLANAQTMEFSAQTIALGSPSKPVKVARSTPQRASHRSDPLLSFEADQIRLESRPRKNRKHRRGKSSHRRRKRIRRR